MTNIKLEKICAGLYEYRDSFGTLWIIEHVTKNEGFSRDEWHIGIESDSHASQYTTKKECIDALEKTIAKQRLENYKLEKRNRKNETQVNVIQQLEKLTTWVKILNLDESDSQWEIVYKLEKQLHSFLIEYQKTRFEIK